MVNRNGSAWLIGIMCLLITGCAVAAVHYYLHTVSHESTDDAFLDGSIVAVSPRVSGHVAKVHVSDNQKVAAGDLLLELDARDFQARLDAAKAQAAFAKAALDHAVTAERMAAARLTSARSAPALMAKSSSQAEESKADVEKSRAEVAQAELNLSYTRILAPIDGYVTKKSVDPGAYVQQGQSLMAIVSTRVWVTANFKETQLTHLRPGQPVTISVDTYPEAVFHGHVDSIQRGTGSRFSLLPPENATGNFVKVVQRIPVKIVFDRHEELAEYLLVPGMSVVPEVDIKADIRATTP